MSNKRYKFIKGSYMITIEYENKNVRSDSVTHRYFLNANKRSELENFLKITVDIIQSLGYHVKYTEWSKR